MASREAVSEMKEKINKNKMYEGLDAFRFFFRKY